MHKKDLDIPLSPAHFLSIASFFSSWEGTMVFYSGGSFSASQKSFLWLFPSESVTCSSWEELQKRIGSFDSAKNCPKWAGYLSYELGCLCDPDRIIPYTASSLPLAYFQRCQLVLMLDHATLKATLFREENLTDDAKKWAGKLLDTSSFLREVKETTPQIQEFSLINPLISSAEYREKIEYIQELIREGEVYQVNLSHEIRLLGKCTPFRVFQTALAKNPMPFSAFLHLKEHHIVSASPERFLSKKGNTLQTWPIKGTMPRGKNREDDEERKWSLLSSEKERAELLMITDLSRNDLGKICQNGSVAVDGMFLLEAYTNVFHLHSIVSGETSPGLHPVELLKQCFPGGSITGCPKLRAQEVIAEVEGRARGIYTGSIGYFLENGDFDFNIAIRTLTFEKDIISLQLGGAIVIDSDPAKEYEETLHKGKTLMETLGMPWDMFF